jgi:hypothetical protein
MTKAPFSLKLEDKLMERVREEAKNDHRPVNNFIELIIIKYFEEIDKQQQKTPGV